MRSKRCAFQKREGKIEWEKITKEMTEEIFLEIFIVKGSAYCPATLMGEEKEKKENHKRLQYEISG